MCLLCNNKSIKSGDGDYFNLILIRSGDGDYFNLILIKSGDGDYFNLILIMHQAIIYNLWCSLCQSSCL